MITAFTKSQTRYDSLQTSYSRTTNCCVYWPNIRIQAEPILDWACLVGLQTSLHASIVAYLKNDYAY